MKRGDIFYADLRPVIGSEQGGIRPVLIIQNDVGNRHSPTVICAAITSKMNKAKLPTHIELDAEKYDMDKVTLVPMRVYIKGSLVKVEMGLARGKKLHDKRQDIAKKDMRRANEREFKIKNI